MAPIAADLDPDWRGPIFKLVVLLRLAVVLNRARSPGELPSLARYSPALATLG